MNIHLEKLEEKDAKALFYFETINREFFETLVPGREENYYIYEHFLSVLNELLQEQKEGKSFFYLIKNDSNAIVGRINLVDIDQEKRIGSIGYRIGEAFLKQGIATKALKLILEETPILNVAEIHAKTTYQNIGSQKVLEHNGFEFDVSREGPNFVHYVWKARIKFW